MHDCYAFRASAGDLGSAGVTGMIVLRTRDGPAAPAIAGCSAEDVKIDGQYSGATPQTRREDPMPLFGPKFAPGTEGPSMSNPRGVTGLPVQPPEVPGSMARRSRMFGEAIRIAESGKDVAAAVSQLLAKEHSFVKWVSLRGGLAFVSIALEDPAISLKDLTKFAGRTIPDGGEELLQRYSKLEGASFSDVLGDPSLTRDPAWHLDLVAWCAAAFAGGGLHRTVLQADIPAAQVLSDPGWYAEPVFSKCERYWDGTDWTARCRALEGRQWQSIVSPF